MTARGGGRVHEVLPASQTELKGPIRGITVGRGGGGVSFVEKKRYEIFERPQRVIVPQKFILTNISMNIP